MMGPMIMNGPFFWKPLLFPFDDAITPSTGKYVGGLVLLFVLAAATHVFAALSRYFASSGPSSSAIVSAMHAGRVKRDDTHTEHAAASSGGASDTTALLAVSASPYAHGSTPSTAQTYLRAYLRLLNGWRLVAAVTFVSQFICAYVVMLAVMTYHTPFFLVAIAGNLVGYFLFTGLPLSRHTARTVATAAAYGSAHDPAGDPVAVNDTLEDTVDPEVLACGCG
eukprot:TRINITY_DN71453_c0_g1_i1.p1 TRINITY_DN71453_c0_g1~~TRINITY_DN71453_c0_g1_i1.p1  ORF type:complete len:223 (-),score=38.80 TRINITY_DN71453_c0_g1_i1:262-930(-)